MVMPMTGMREPSTARASAAWLAGARNRSAPAAAAARALASMPPISPTVPSRARVPVPAISRPAARSVGRQLVVDGEAGHQTGRRPLHPAGVDGHGHRQLDVDVGEVDADPEPQAVVVAGRHGCDRDVVHRGRRHDLDRERHRSRPGALHRGRQLLTGRRRRTVDGRDDVTDVQDRVGRAARQDVLDASGRSS